MTTCGEMFGKDSFSQVSISNSKALLVVFPILLAIGTVPTVRAEKTLNIRELSTERFKAIFLVTSFSFEVSDSLSFLCSI